MCFRKTFCEHLHGEFPGNSGCQNLQSVGSKSVLQSGGVVADSGMGRGGGCGPGVQDLYAAGTVAG